MSGVKDIYYYTERHQNIADELNNIIDNLKLRSKDRSTLEQQIKDLKDSFEKLFKLETKENKNHIRLLMKENKTLEEEKNLISQELQYYKNLYDEMSTLMSHTHKSLENNSDFITDYQSFQSLNKIPEKNAKNIRNDGLADKKESNEFIFDVDENNEFIFDVDEYLRGTEKQKSESESSESCPSHEEKPNRNEPGKNKYWLASSTEEIKKVKNEILVLDMNNPISSIKKGLLLFKKNKASYVVIKASGLAMPMAVRVAEEIKRREPRLHQQNFIQNRVFKDLYKPLEEGLDDVVKKRVELMTEIILSKKPIDTNHYGYQTPIADNLVTDINVKEVEKL